ncbi:MAG TPA: hypothetical protein PLO78_03960 [Candidatus Omnitrophota bacterium]|nr:hypothetical protein [Candidatus Omnitrophota bacterium]
MTKIKMIIGMFGVSMLAGIIWLLMLMIQDRALSWILGACVFCVLLIASLAGMWQSKKWALRLSWFLATIVFGLGCYIAQFAWTFWLFQEPTLMDRIRSVLHPGVSLYLIIPLLWFSFTLRAAFRSQFR